MSYHRSNLGAWTAFGDLDGGAFRNSVNAAISQIRASNTQLTNELTSSIVAKVFVQSAIDSTASLTLSVENACSGTIPRLLDRAANGDADAGNNLVNLLGVLRDALTSQKADFEDLWAQTPAATRLLIEVLAGLDTLAQVVVAYVQNNFPNFIPTTSYILYAALGLAGLALFLRLKG